MPSKKILLLSRKTFPGSQSIEYLFNQLYQEFNAIGIKIEQKQLPYYSKGLVNRLLNTFELLKYRNQIVHITGDVHYATLGIWFSKRVLTIHDLSFLERTTGLTRYILKLFWVTLPVKFAHRVTTVSEATKRAILAEMPSDGKKIVVIPNFVDPIFVPVERSINAESPRILQIGTTFNKNLDRLCEALDDIKCTLIIIGTLNDEQIAKLIKHQVKYENKHNLSWPALFDEYRKADLLAFVSTIEGFGMPIIEAQACGLPVLTSNCSSMPEVAGNAAFFVDPLSTTAIRHGIEKIINDEALRKNLVKNGYINSAKYEKRKIAEAYLKLYQDL